MDLIHGNNGFHVLRTSDVDRWQDILNKTQEYDLYHLPSYSRLAEMQGEGDAVLLALEDGDCTMAFPLLLREIDFPGGAGLKDATSCYGYPGPIASKADIPDSIRLRFTEQVQEFLDSEGVVTAFTRLNPLLDQTPVLNGYGEVVDIGSTISIDLSVPPDEQFARYRKTTRYEVRRLRKMGFVCKEVGLEYLDKFISIYYSTMDSVNAGAEYYFDDYYFKYLLEKMADVFHLFVCLDGDKIACAAMFGLCGSIAQYHLAGTAEGYRHMAPMKLLLDDARLWAVRAGARAMHLGGGVGAGHDGLFAFKHGFSDRQHTYRIWRHVVNAGAYAMLCESARSTGAIPDDSYFPLYRHPALSRESQWRSALGLSNASDEIPAASGTYSR